MPSRKKGKTVGSRHESSFFTEPKMMILEPEFTSDLSAATKGNDGVSAAPRLSSHRPCTDQDVLAVGCPYRFVHGGIGHGGMALISSGRKNWRRARRARRKSCTASASGCRRAAGNGGDQRNRTLLDLDSEVVTTPKPRTLCFMRTFTSSPRGS